AARARPGPARWWRGDPGRDAVPDVNGSARRAGRAVVAVPAVGAVRDVGVGLRRAGVNIAAGTPGRVRFCLRVARAPDRNPGACDAIGVAERGEIPVREGGP